MAFASLTWISLKTKMKAHRIVHYVRAEDGYQPFDDWLEQLRDIKGQLAVIRRLGRVQEGNLGDWKYCRDGVRELRLDVGPGYRVYFGVAQDCIVLLLCGDKQSQASDIDKAVHLWDDWQRRQDDEE